MRQNVKRRSGSADMVILNGKIITVDEYFSIKQAVAIKDGRILAVGTDDEIKGYTGKKTQVLDVRGKSVLPGINDSHIHASLYGSTLPPLAVDIGAARSKEDIFRLLDSAIKTAKPGMWVRGVGLDAFFMSSGFNKSSLPSRQELDRISPASPVYLGSTPFHGPQMALFNTRAIELTGLEDYCKGKKGEEVEIEPGTGEITGLISGNLAGAAVRDLVPPFTRAEKTQAIMAAMQKLNSFGITSITEPGLGPGGDRLYGGLWDNECLYSYNDLFNENRLTLRVSLLLLFTPYGTYDPDMMRIGLAHASLHTGFGNEWLRIGGIKLYADGIPPMRTAWMREDYPGGGNGKLVFPGKDDSERCKMLGEIISMAHNLGFQIGIHATGDRAISACVEYFARAEEANPKKLRHYIIHGDFVAAEDAIRMARYGVGISVQPALAGAFSTVLRAAVGAEKAEEHLLLKTLIDCGVHVAGGSDAPVISPDWREGIQEAVMRSKSEVKSENKRGLKISEAIRLYTAGGAWQDHLEQLKGSIEYGKLADFCILEGDLLEAGAEHLPELPVSMTIVGGNPVYERR